MLAQRAAGAAPAARGVAEHLPFRDGAFDAALAIFTIHHWTDWRAGIAEVRRVAAAASVILTWDPAIQGHFWLTDEYLPEALTDDQFDGPPFAELDDALGGIRVEPVPVPADCQDGFFAALLGPPRGLPRPRRARRHLLLRPPRPGARRGAHRPPRRRPRVRRLGRAHPDLRTQPELDVGYRLVISPSLTSPPGRGAGAVAVRSFVCRPHSVCWKCKRSTRR